MQHVEVVEALLKHNPKLALATDSEGFTPLHMSIASDSNSNNITMMLLTAGSAQQKSYINMASNAMFTPLMEAVLRNDTNLVSMLLANGADVAATTMVSKCIVSIRLSYLRKLIHIGIG